MSTPTIVVLTGDQTGQELLDEALRVLDPAVTRCDVDFETFDLSLENRRAIYESTLEAVYDGIRTSDLQGQASTTEFTDEVIRRVKAKLEVWDALG